MLTTSNGYKLAFAICILTLIVVSHQYVTDFSIYKVYSDLVVKQIERNLGIVLNDRSLGTTDASVLLPIFSAIYNKYRQKHNFDRFVFVDVGANIGTTTSEFLAAFSDYPCRLVKTLTIDHTYHSACRESQELFVTIEPLPSSVEHILATHKTLKWDTGPVVVLQIAASDKDEETIFYGSPGESEQSSFDTQAASSSTFTNITAAKLDTLFSVNKAINSSSVNSSKFEQIQSLLKGKKWHIFLLKVDAEGYDFKVLKGAELLLKQKLVKFVTFEYNSKWFSNGRTESLKNASDYMDRLGYFCYWITTKNLIPLSQMYWDDKYEIRRWSNVFCGLENDTDVTIVTNFVNEVPFGCDNNKTII